MAGLRITGTGSRTALFAGLLLAVAMYLVYLALSLTDMWGYFPPVVQAIVYGLLFTAMALSVMGGFMGKIIWRPSSGLRALALSGILLSIAAILAGADSPRLLEIAVKPRAVFSYPVAEIIMTVTPPSYSGREEFTENLSLGEENSGSLKPVAQGSEIIVRVMNSPYAPVLVAGTQRVEFLTGSEGGYIARFTLKDEREWLIRQGSRTIGRWPVVLLEDEAPVIERADFHNMMTGDGLFGLSLDLSDDYGVQNVVIGVGQGSGSGDLHDRTRLALGNLKVFSGELYINLSVSDFAGSQVDLVVEVTDQAGQQSRKIISDLTLPKRDFSNAIARRIIEIRDEIIKYPDRRKNLARQLMALGLAPDDTPMPSIYYMALRSAYWRLASPKDDSDINSARDILWHLAGKLEDGGRGGFTRDILSRLASLKLSLYQRGDLTVLRKQLQEIDKGLVLFRRNRISSLNAHTQPEKYDVRALRGIYGKILSLSYHKKFDQAVDLVSYLERGFIYNDSAILTGQGYARFQIAHHARETINIIEKTQQKVMSFVLKKTVRIEFASRDMVSDLNAPRSEDIAGRDILNWIDIQQKLGEKMNDLGRSLQKSGINAARFTVPAGDLAREVAHSMEDGDMSAAVSYQNQIMTILHSLKNMLDQEIFYRPKRPLEKAP